MKIVYFFVLFCSIFSLNGMFEGTCFDRAKMIKCQCIKTNFKKASFVETDLSGSNLIGANFEDADLTNATLTDCIINTKPCISQGVAISATNFRGAIVEGIVTDNLSSEVVSFIMAQARKSNQ